MRTLVELAVEIITTHKNTDFDGLASVFAARILFPEALPVLPESLNSNVRRFLSLHKDHFSFYRVKDLPPEEVTRLVIVDTASWARIEGKDRFIGLGNPEIVVIDHHPVQGDIRSNRLICRPAGAAVSLVLEEILKQRPTQLSAIQATLFISGIYEDT
ncbi:MAG: DHH family phosphoesterase, partial [Desulfobacterales bacterium]|nr:DHH family phosphoesterase [Desulfobacterales bacterium]